MVATSELWLPILLSGVFVFAVSSVIHMILPIHRSDFRGLPGEDDLRAAFNANNVPPGDYMIPHASSMQEMSSPEMAAKLELGPVASLTVRPKGGWHMGPALGQWFVYSLLISLFAGYLATLSCARGADYGAVSRVTSTVAILGYSTAYIPQSIWKGQSWTTTLKFAFDGVLYGLVTGGTFGWLWPAA